MAIMRSSLVIMPISPCKASAACMKKAGVPVEAKVAAILRPIWPDLPMPVTTTRPRHASTRCTASVKRTRKLFLSACRAVISISKLRCAEARYLVVDIVFSIRQDSVYCSHTSIQEGKNMSIVDLKYNRLGQINENRHFYNQ